MAGEEVASELLLEHLGMRVRLPPPQHVEPRRLSHEAFCSALRSASNACDFEAARFVVDWGEESARPAVPRLDLGGLGQHESGRATGATNTGGVRRPASSFREALRFHESGSLSARASRSSRPASAAAALRSKGGATGLASARVSSRQWRELQGVRPLAPWQPDVAAARLTATANVAVTAASGPRRHIPGPVMTSRCSSARVRRPEYASTRSSSARAELEAALASLSPCSVRGGPRGSHAHGDEMLGLRGTVAFGATIPRGFEESALAATERQRQDALPGPGAYSPHLAHHVPTPALAMGARRAAPRAAPKVLLLVDQLSLGAERARGHLPGAGKFGRAARGLEATPAAKKSADAALSAPRLRLPGRPVFLRERATARRPQTAEAGQRQRRRAETEGKEELREEKQQPSTDEATRADLIDRTPSSVLPRPGTAQARLNSPRSRRDRAWEEHVAARWRAVTALFEEERTRGLRRAPPLVGEAPNAGALLDWAARAIQRFVRTYVPRFAQQRRDAAAQVITRAVRRQGATRREQRRRAAAGVLVSFFRQTVPFLRILSPIEAFCASVLRVQRFWRLVLARREAQVRRLVTQWRQIEAWARAEYESTESAAARRKALKKAMLGAQSSPPFLTLFDAEAGPANFAVCEVPESIVRAVLLETWSRRRREADELVPEQHEAEAGEEFLAALPIHMRALVAQGFARLHRERPDLLSLSAATRLAHILLVPQRRAD